MISLCRTSALAALALAAGLSCDAAIAAKPDGNYFEDAPNCCEPGTDVSTVFGSNLSTADVAIEGEVLKPTTTFSYPIYTDGTYWVSNGQFGASLFWSAANGEALRKDFSDWPTYRVKFWFYPTAVCTGYLAAYSSRGKLMAQKTFTSDSQPVVLDTGALKGRIGYILATYGGDCGRLGKIGCYHNLH
jgi:hypothetical protein